MNEETEQEQNRFQGDSSPTLEQRLHNYHQELSRLAMTVRAEASLRHKKGGAEITLAWQGLLQAKMWLGMALGELGRNPPWPKDGNN